MNWYEGHSISFGIRKNQKTWAKNFIIILHSIIHQHQGTFAFPNTYRQNPQIIFLVEGPIRGPFIAITAAYASPNRFLRKCFLISGNKSNRLMPNLGYTVNFGAIEYRILAKNRSLELPSELWHSSTASLWSSIVQLGEYIWEPRFTTPLRIDRVLFQKWNFRNRTRFS